MTENEDINQKIWTFSEFEKNIFINKAIESNFVQKILNSKIFNKSNDFVRKNSNVFFTLFGILTIIYSIFQIVYNIIIKPDSISTTFRIISIIIAIVIYWIAILIWIWIIKKQKGISHICMYILIFWILLIISQIFKSITLKSFPVSTIILRAIILIIYAIITLYLIKNKDLFKN